MGTPKFLEITTDPYTNDSDQFILFLQWSTAFQIPAPALGAIYATQVVISDPAGRTFPIDQIAVNSSLDTDATAYPYVLSVHGNFRSKTTFILPPGWKAQYFTLGLCLIGSLEDLRGYL